MRKESRMTQECIAGLAGGNVERISFICKLRLEIEAWKHSKSGISQGLLKSFFYLLFPFPPIHSKEILFSVHLERAACLEYGKEKKEKSQNSSFFCMEYSIL